ncbi:MAG TPA: adenylate/guanylate cyclase domain-containing protein [Candidatus Binatia bacterium]|nr:adenylate/guanylate cyclase domain-containing protein [Candidatus Binatia bacterium]
MATPCAKRAPIGLWFFLGATVLFFANVLAVCTTTWTIGIMGSVSDFAAAVRAHDERIMPYFNGVAFPLMTMAVILYLRPIGQYLRAPGEESPPPRVQRRIVNAPLVLAMMGFAPWLFGCVLMPTLTLLHFGRWSVELISQHLLSPLVSGFLAATVSFFFLDWLFRATIIPHVFPQGGLAATPRALTLSVRGRMLLFLLAIAFTPLFTLLGIVRAAAVRVDAGASPAAVVQAINHASEVTFLVYVSLGVALTLILAGTLTRPLRAMATALRHVQAGDLSVAVQATASDEVGVLEDGVNAMVAALREKEHILETFGRVVEPSVRDQLLAGELRLGGEVRHASVLFCDLRGFTALAEQSPPTDVVATLNEFFSAMTNWVRQCGGFVDKFIGDAVLVVFGLFDSDGRGGHADSAAASIRCALGMRERLAELNATRALNGQPPLTMAVSVHTGEVVAGRIGAEDRHEYTVIGDTVNVAARLQQVCKERGSYLLMSEATYDLARTRGVTPEVTLSDSISLRGRSEPVRVLGVV